MPVLEKSGLRELAIALTSAPSHHTHFIITGIDKDEAQKVIDFLKNNNFHTPRTNTAGDYKFLAIPTPKGEERGRLIEALTEAGISMGPEAYQGHRR
ncbi:MAG: hypothetical protein AABY33_08690 [Pseudomonadota bacterium]